MTTISATAPVIRAGNRYAWVLVILACCAFLPACSDGNNNPEVIADARTPTQLCEVDGEHLPDSEESNEESFVLPDPLVMLDGSPVQTPDMWIKQRRPELLELFAVNMYGLTPEKPLDIEWEVLDNTSGVLSGTADRIQVRGHLGGRGGPTVDVLIYLPAGISEPVPLYISMSLLGNHAATADPGVIFSPLALKGSTPEELEAGRNSRFGSLPGFPHVYIERGYGIAVFWYQELARDPLFPDTAALAEIFNSGVFPLFYSEGQTTRNPDDWGGIGAWAWGISRVIDWAETEPKVDSARIAVFGASRLGKAALWAAAQDERIKVTWAAITGSGGAVLNRRIYTPVFQWFAENFNCWAGRVHELPIDQHELIALLAPRPVYITEGAVDPFSDATGAFLSAVGANPVYALFGLEGLPATSLPEPGERSVGTIGFSLSTEGHTVTPKQLEEALEFVDRFLE